MSDEKITVQVTFIGGPRDLQREVMSMWSIQRWIVIPVLEEIPTPLSMRMMLDHGAGPATAAARREHAYRIEPVRIHGTDALMAVALYDGVR